MDGIAYTLKNEGSRLAAYDDATGEPVPAGGHAHGTLSIGVGHTGPEVVPGLIWSQHEVDAAYMRDYSLATRGAALALGGECWLRLDLVRKAALVDLDFELGMRGLEGFEHMILAVRAFQWAEAAAQLQASRLDRQVPRRVARNGHMLLKGEWPPADMW